jgi:hypothetical protein
VLYQLKTNFIVFVAPHHNFLVFFITSKKQVSYEHGSLTAMKFSQGNTTSHIYIYTHTHTHTYNNNNNNNIENIFAIL